MTAVDTRPVVVKVLDRVAPEKPAERPPPPQQRHTPWETGVLAVLALAVYALVGWYLRYVLHFAVGDALARTANAKYMLFARDAHFAALGFVWMPIPTVSQLPFVAVLEPFGRAADAGWATTAVWGAGTVLVLGRLSRDLGVRRPLGLLLVAAYAFNPVVVYYAANGMSEGPLFFFIAVTFLGLLRYLRGGDTAALVVTAVGLTGCALDRYEAIPLVAGVGLVLLVADLRRTGRWAALTATTLALLPAVASVAAWFVYMRVIKGSFRAFITDASGNYTTGQGTAFTPATTATTAAPTAPPAPYTLYKDVAHGMDWLQYSVHWCLAFAPALVLLPLLLLPPVRRAFGGVALLGFLLWLPGVTAYLLRYGGSAGDPRYFTSVVITTAIGLIYLASRVRRGWLQVPLALVLVAALGLGWVTGVNAQTDRVSTGQEGEWRVFEAVRGNVDTRDLRGIVADRKATQQIDRLLQPGDVAMLDVRFDFEVELFSEKPKQFIINNDQDYDAIRADPYFPGRRIDYLVMPAPGTRGAGFDFTETVLGQGNADPTNLHWEKVDLPGVTQYVVYHRISYTPLTETP